MVARFDAFGVRGCARSCRNASISSRHSLARYSFVMVTGGIMPPNHLGVPAHICAVGLYCMATRSHLRHTRVALATKPCCQEHRTGTARMSSPQGGTIPNANAASKYFTPTSLCQKSLSKISTETIQKQLYAKKKSDRLNRHHLKLFFLTRNACTLFIAKAKIILHTTTINGLVH